MASLPDTRYSLLVRLSDPGDIAAWSEFKDIYENAIYRYSRSRGLQDSDAQEVVQQVLLVTYQVVSEWEPSGRAGSFRSWLLQTARRVCLRALRNRSHCDRPVGDGSLVAKLHNLAASDGPGDADHRDWQRWALCWAVGQIEREIEPATWRAFWLVGIEGVPPADVAQQLGVKVGAVYSAKYRSIARIRKRVEELSRSCQ